MYEKKFIHYEKLYFQMSYIPHYLIHMYSIIDAFELIRDIVWHVEARDRWIEHVLTILQLASVILHCHYVRSYYTLTYQ